MAQYQLSYNKAHLRELERRLASMPKLIPRVIKDAVNRTATQARTQVVRAMAAKVTLSQKKIRSRLVLVKAVLGRAVATIRISGARFPLGDFQARKTKKGPSYKIEKSGPRKVWASSPQVPVFFQKYGAGRKGIFKRKGKSRLPIEAVFGPSIMGIGLKKGLGPARSMIRNVMTQSRKKLAHNLDGQIRRHLERKR